MLVLAGLAFGMRAPFAGVLIGLGFIAVVAISCRPSPTRCSQPGPSVMGSMMPDSSNQRDHHHVDQRGQRVLALEQQAEENA